MRKIINESVSGKKTYRKLEQMDKLYSKDPKYLSRLKQEKAPVV